MIDNIRTILDDACAICDDNDPCLPRWEDDGGGPSGPMPPARTCVFEDVTEQVEDEGDHDRPPEKPFPRLG